MESSNSRKISTISLVAIFSLFFVTMGTAETTPAMAKFAAVFPNENYMLISTLPALFVVIGTFLARVVAGKKISYRTLSITGCILYLIGLFLIITCCYLKFINI